MINTLYNDNINTNQSKDNNNINSKLIEEKDKVWNDITSKITLLKDIYINSNSSYIKSSTIIDHTYKSSSLPWIPKADQLKINELELSQLLLHWYIDNIKKYFNNHLCTEFWEYFGGLNKIENISTINIIHDDYDDKYNTQFINAIEVLYRIFGVIELTIQSLYNCAISSSSNKNEYKLSYWIDRVHCLLLTSLTNTQTQRKVFDNLLFKFFEKEFISFSKSFIGSTMTRKKKKRNGGDDHDEDEDNDYEEQEKDEEEEEEEDDNRDLSQMERSQTSMIEMSFMNEGSFTDINTKEITFMNLCVKLNKLNFIIISEDIFTTILLSKITENIEKKCKDVFDKYLLKSIIKWADNIIFKWLSIILLRDGQDINDYRARGQDVFEQWRNRMEFSIYENFSEQRISQLFDMIVQFPDSTPALEDLAICYQKIPIQKSLITGLVNQFKARLLHPGANTNDIITQYISTIQAMKLIDPTCFVVDAVGHPIRTYLAQREDTIRSIISSFTDEESDIYTEFCRVDEDDQGGVGGDHLCDGDIDIYIDDYAGDEDQERGASGQKSKKQWTPATKESHPTLQIQKYKDTITSLVNIYDSTDLFVNEYRQMLSQRLYALTNYDDIDKEIKNVELLKLRFGEQSLVSCEIMIKDIQDSKRLNQQISNQIKNSNFTSLILSNLFWPTIKNEEFNYPKNIIDQMENFNKEYQKIKAPRKLEYHKHMGFVELDIEVNGKITSLTVSPLHASIISLFQVKDKLTIEEISNQLNMKIDNVKRKIIYWINQQIITECDRGVYKIVTMDKNEEDKDNEDDDDDGIQGDSSGGGGTLANQGDGDDEESSSSANKEKEEEQWKVVENFVIGMLTNFKSMPIDRMHNMLTMFNPDVYTSTMPELKQFLTTLQNQDKIELFAGEYKIKK